MNLCRLLLCIRSEAEKVVHRTSEILFAAEIAFRDLHRYVPVQELNLLQLTAVVVSQLRFPLNIEIFTAA